MSFLQWLVVDAIEAASDTVLALSAAGFVWTLTHGLRSVIVGTYLRSSSWISARRILGKPLSGRYHRHRTAPGNHRRWKLRPQIAYVASNDATGSQSVPLSASARWVPELESENERRKSLN